MEHSLFMRIPLFVLLCLTAGQLYAQAPITATCQSLRDYIHAAASGWHLSSPTTFTPLSQIKTCVSSSAAPNAALCVHQASTLEAARARASSWMRELTSCLNVRQTTEIRTIKAGGSTQEVLTFDPHIHNGLPIEISIRLHHPTQQHQASVSFQVIPRPTSARAPQSWCSVVQELINPQNIRQNWNTWKGPLLESSDDFQQYVCSRIPPGAASRFDCDLQITPQRLYWSARWALPMTDTSVINERALERATHISSCRVGLQWQNGNRRHTWLNPENRIKMELVANPNDSGRGPTLTLTVEHWKP